MDTSSELYDLIILGGGPAGLAAGIYAGRARLKTLLIEKGVFGGQISITHEIENYPGQLPEGESGAALIARMTEQVAKFGTETVFDVVNEVILEGEEKQVICDHATYKAKTLIIATGAFPRWIGCKGEADFAGRGVSYCATCDANFFQDFDVYVVGGGDSAVEEAMYLSRFARKVTIIHRRDELRAAKSLQEKAFGNPKIEFLWDSVVDELHGEALLSGMTVRNVKSNDTIEIVAKEEDGMFGVFGFVGNVPKSELFAGKLEMENGYIVTDEEMHTNIPGVFAVGDVRKKTLRQVVTAVSDGAIAAVQADKYLE